MHDHLAFQEFHRGRVPGLIADQVMNLNEIDDADACRIPESFRRCRRTVEQILNPFLRAQGWKRIVFRVFRLVEPHFFDHQSHLIHSAVRIFPPVLIEGDATVFGNPFRRIGRVANTCGFRYAAFVDEDQCVADVVIVVSAEQNFAVVLQAESSASEGFIYQKANNNQA
jgi:hypothetical protein